MRVPNSLLSNLVYRTMARDAARVPDEVASRGPGVPLLFTLHGRFGSIPPS